MIKAGREISLPAIVFKSGLHSSDSCLLSVFTMDFSPFLVDNKMR